MTTKATKFRSVFPRGHVVLPVIHVEHMRQALHNVGIARDAGAAGAFLINHSIGVEQLLDIHGAAAAAHPGFWIGVNCLGLDACEALRRVGDDVGGVWTDNAMIQEFSSEQSGPERALAIMRERAWKGLYFGGVAFKYQRRVDRLAEAAAIAGRYMDVVTTSGSGTGEAAEVGKIATMKAALGDLPLAIASGITPENVEQFLPHSDCYLVATGISTSFDMLDPERTRMLVRKVAAWDARA